LKACFEILKGHTRKSRKEREGKKKKSLSAPNRTTIYHTRCLPSHVKWKQHPTPNWLTNMTLVPCLNHKWLTRYLNWWESRLVNSQQWQFSSSITPWWVGDSSKLMRKQTSKQPTVAVLPASGMNVTLESFQIHLSNECNSGIIPNPQVS